jgi:hypothetical protein
MAYAARNPGTSPVLRRSRSSRCPHIAAGNISGLVPCSGVESLAVPTQASSDVPPPMPFDDDEAEYAVPVSKYSREHDVWGDPLPQLPGGKACDICSGTRSIARQSLSNCNAYPSSAVPSAQGTRVLLQTAGAQTAFGRSLIGPLSPTGLVQSVRARAQHVLRTRWRGGWSHTFVTGTRIRSRRSVQGQVHRGGGQGQGVAILPLVRRWRQCPYGE